MSDERDYPRGLLDAAVIVSKESSKRGKAGEMEAMYALNTAWHAIWHLIDSTQAETARSAPKSKKTQGIPKATE